MTSSKISLAAEKMDGKEDICEEMEIKGEFFKSPLHSSGENKSRLPITSEPAVDESSRIMPQDFPCKKEDIGEMSFKIEIKEEFIEDATPVEESREPLQSKHVDFAANDSSEESLKSLQQLKAKCSSSRSKKLISDSNSDEIVHHKREKLNINSKTKHDKKLTKCSSCSYHTLYKGNLKKHLLIHTGEKPFKCSFCSYQSACGSNLKVHLRIHTGEKPFKCCFCSYEAAYKQSLESHLRMHTGEKPFKCSFCSYEATYKHCLVSHLRGHRGEKPFKCSICNYEASQKSHIYQHQRIHTGEKPFKCSFCSYRAAQKATLIKHLISHRSKRP